jgi:hypothetical protein
MKTLPLLSFLGCLALCEALTAESAKPAGGAKQGAGASGTKADAAHAPQPDPNAWSTHLYRFSDDDLIRGFVTRDRGQLHAPAMPKPDASAAEIEKFLRQSNDVINQYLSSVAAIPLVKGSLAAYDPVNKTLAVRTLNSTQDLLDNYAKVLARRVPNYLTFNLHLVETDAAILRGMVKEAAVQAEHGPLWQRMQTLMTQGKARELRMLHLDSRSGQRVAIEPGQRYTYGTGFLLGEHGWCYREQTTRTVGTTLEIDPVVGPDGRTLDLSFALQNHCTPPTERWPLVGQNGTQKLEALVTDFHTSRVTTAVTVLDGMTKMLGVWKPEGVPEPDRADHLQAAFLTSDIVMVQPTENDRVLQLLKAHGEKVEPTPPPGKPPVETLPSGMVLRRFHIPPDFLTATGGGNEMAKMAPPADAFAAPAGGAAPRSEAHAMRSVTAMDVLKIAGIPFPEGSSANFNSATSELIVRNTPENIEKVARYVDSLLMHIPQFISCTLHIVQADAKTLQEIAEQSRHIADHSVAWKTLEDAVAQGHAKILDSSWMETRSGQRASIESGTEYITLGPPSVETSEPKKTSAPAPAANNNKDANGKANVNANTPPSAPESVVLTLSAEPVMTPVGTKWEIDPVIDPDGETVDVSISLDYHYAPPSFRYDTTPGGEKVLRANAAATDFHKVDLGTSITLSSGMMRLLGVWKPEGAPEFEKGDVLQAAFLQINVVPLEEPEKK